MDLYEFLLQLAESQGIAALFGLLFLFQNYIYTKRILAKNCELEKFLMDCLREHLRDRDETEE